MNNKPVLTASIEAEFEEGTFRATFNGIEWRSSDTHMENICNMAMKLVPFAYYPHHINDPAIAVAKFIGARVVSLASPFEMNDDPSDAVY